jgi:transcriptional regulator with XRE-family HTH domain
MTSYVRPMEWAEEIGARIREARKARGLNESDLADLLIVHRNTVQNYEKGQGIPNRRMQEIADALNVSFRWLLHGHEYEDRLDTLATELGQIRSQLAGLQTALEHLADTKVEAAIEGLDAPPAPGATGARAHGSEG